MAEPAYLSSIRESYDSIADVYAGVVPERFQADALGRSMLGAFAERVRAGGGRPVADLGCGPGHVTAHLAGLGLPAFGVDLSARMVEIARRTYPGLRFEVGSMTALDLPDGALDGVVAWWSIVNLPPAALPEVFAEFHRVLAPGGRVLVGFHVGDERVRPGQFRGVPVSYEAQMLPPDGVAALLADAGLVVTARLIEEPDLGRTSRPQAYLLARRPEE